MTDAIDRNTTLVAGATHTDRGTVVQGNQPGDTSVVVDIDALAVGDRALISLQVTINSGASLTQLQNQALASFVNGESNPNGQTSVVSDDPDTTAPLDATITPLNVPLATKKLFLPVIQRPQG